MASGDSVRAQSVAQYLTRPDSHVAGDLFAATLVWAFL